MKNRIHNTVILSAFLIAFAATPAMAWKGDFSEACLWQKVEMERSGNKDVEREGSGNKGVEREGSGNKSVEREGSGNKSVEREGSGNKALCRRGLFDFLPF